MCSKLSVQIFPKHTGSNRTLLIICKGLCPKLDIAILRPLLSLFFLAASCMNAKTGGSYFPVFPKSPSCPLVCAGTVVHVAVDNLGTDLAQGMSNML